MDTFAYMSHTYRTARQDRRTERQTGKADHQGYYLFIQISAYQRQNILWVMFWCFHVSPVLFCSGWAGGEERAWNLVIWVCFKMHPKKPYDEDMLINVQWGESPYS